MLAPRDRDRVGVRRVKAFAPQRWAYEYPQLSRTLKRLHAREFTDTEISARLNVSAMTVWRWRTALGLPAHGHTSERYRKRVRKATRKQLRETGVRSLIELRLLSHRVEAAKKGELC